MSHQEPKPHICPNPTCENPVNKHNSNFCAHCGAKLTTDKYEVPVAKDEGLQRINAKQRYAKMFFWELASGTIPFLQFEQFKTLRHMLWDPGNSLKESVSFQRDSEKTIITRKALTYFFLFMTFDLFLTSNILERPPFEYNNQLLSKLSGWVVAPVVLILLMLGIWLIGYITLSSKWNIGKHKVGVALMKHYYSPREVFVISLYIYGTNFFLGPVSLIIFFPLKNPIDNKLNLLFGLTGAELTYYENMCTDIPLALFMLYMLYMLIKKTEEYKHFYLRFAAFCVCSITYYGLMYPLVSKLTKI